MKMNKKAVSPVIAVMLLVAVAVAAVGAYFIWYKSFQASSQKNVEEQTGTIGSKLRITNITNDNKTFYITVKNATGKDLGYWSSPDDQTQSNVTITVKDSQGNEIGVQQSGGTKKYVGQDSNGNYASFTGVTPGNEGVAIESDSEGQIELHLDPSDSNLEIQPGETYTIIITAAGVTTTEKYTAI